MTSWRRRHHLYTPSPFTPLGMKDVGEAGAIGPMAAIGNAVAGAIGWLVSETRLLLECIKRLTDAALSGTRHANALVRRSILSDFGIHATDVVDGMQGGSS